MLYILHGDDTAASRLKLDELLIGKKWVVRLDGGKTTLREIEETVESQELFSDSKTVVIENFIKLRENLKKILPYIFKQSKNMDIILWHGDVLNKPMLSKLKDAKIFAFTFPKNFYVFLDEFRPKNAKKLHTLLLDIEKRFSDEQIFYALVKRVRQLLMLKAKEYTNLKEVSTLADWQRARLHSQSKTWTEEKLIGIYKKLFDLEVAMKTSALTTTLSHHLDILIVTKL